LQSSNHHRVSLSRRRFLIGAGAGFAGLLGACSGPDDSDIDNRDGRSEISRSTPTGSVDNPSQSTKHGATATSPPNPTAEGEPAVEIANDSTPGTVAGDPATPGVEPTPGDPPSGVATTTREPSQIAIDYIPVVSRRLQIRDIPYDRLEAIWNGEITNWSELGEPGSHPVKRVSVDGLAGPFSAEKAELNIEHIDDLESFLHFETGTIAFLPRQRVDFRYRHLKVDGVDHLVHTDRDNPLRTTLQVDPRAPEHFDLIRTAGRGPQPVSMTWVGDIIFGRFVHKALERIGDFSAAFWDIYPELTWADVTIGNLECSLSDNIPQPADAHTFSFTTVSAAVEGLKLAEIDVLCRANNHSFDFGVQGMVDTHATLDEAGIPYFGMGHNLDEARSAVVVDLNGVSYAFIGYNGITDHWDGAGPTWAGTMPMQPEYVIQDIQRELAAGHVVIPYFHWGEEYVADPTEEQRYFAHLAIDHGAAMVMGTHPHWVQAVETYRGKAIVYSLGNFIFDQAWSIETQQGMVAHVWMKGSDVLSIDLVPVFIEAEHRPRVMGPYEAVPVLNRVWEASERIIVNG
jgi:poly-gamma-glutamate capsule biosynthesis protein CapA/YwtB (metallophosphatase superfamily)